MKRLFLCLGLFCATAFMQISASEMDTTMIDSTVIIKGTIMVGTTVNNAFAMRTYEIEGRVRARIQMCFNGTGEILYHGDTARITKIKWEMAHILVNGKMYYANFNELKRCSDYNNLIK